MGIEVPIFRGCIYAYFQTNLNGDKTYLSWRFIKQDGS
jgi:hypothetical protein